MCSARVKMQETKRFKVDLSNGMLWLSRAHEPAKAFNLTAAIS